MMLLAETPGLPFWQDFWSVFSDPAHALTEIAWSLIFDVVVVFLVYQTLIKRWLAPKW